MVGVVWAAILGCCCCCSSTIFSGGGGDCGLWQDGLVVVALRGRCLAGAVVVRRRLVGRTGGW